MKTITLSRTGKPDFALQGNELCRVSSQRTAATQEKFDRWHELSLFETKDEFFAYVLYCSTWPSEKMQHPDLVRAPSLFLLFEALALYDPSQHSLLRPERTEEEKT